MRLIERIGCELLPVCPYLIQHLGVVAILLATLNELWLHGVDNVLFLLTHSLTQGIALTTGKVGQLTRQQHHLLLIDGDAIGVLEVFLHAGDVVLDFLATILTGDERRNVVHRSRTVEGVHGNEVLEHRRMKLAEVFLHTCRLKLEGTDGAALLIELVSLGVVDGDMVQVNINATCLLDNGAGLFLLRQCLQSQEVHLDESGRLNHVAVVLGAVGLSILEVGVVGSRDGHPVRYRVTADNEATGMDTRATHRALQHLGILDGVTQRLVGRSLSLLQLPDSLDGVRQIHLRRLAIDIGQTVGNGLTQGIRHGNRHLLHTSHVLDRVLRGHGGIGDDMCTVLVTVLIHHPLQHLAATIVVEVGIDIRQ